jgi:Site-specific recombinases, DNA invertase Pin homologs
MKTIGYLRISSDKQQLDSQRHLLLEFAHKERIQIDEFIEVEISSRKNQSERRIDEVLQKLKKGDLLLTAELSRLGRNMLETLNIANELTERGIFLKCVRQPELNTTGVHGKLIMAIFGYFAESEREFISLRTKQGLEAAKASGKVLGRPKGCRNKKGLVLAPFKQQILDYLKMGLPIASIRKIINNQAVKSVSYNTFSDYVKELRVQLEPAS